MSFWSSVVSGAGNLLGGLLGSRSSESAGNKNADLQRQFAKNGIQWKVADAKKAGIHPLYALGANTVSASPAYAGDTSVGQAVSNIGQDISGAMMRTAAKEDQLIAKEMAAVQLNNARLQGDLIQEQILASQARRTPVTPGVPAATGLGDFTWKPSEIPTTRPGQSHIMAGPGVAAYQEADFGPFKLNLLSPTVSEQLDDMDMMKYALMYAGNKPQLDQMFSDAVQHYMEPVFSRIYEGQKFVENIPNAVEDAANDLRAWAARKRIPKWRQKPYWKN